ncbi:MAG TPA: FAD/NAD(P)-binding protein [Steroidobacteraceae bacterium]|jgi:uncharacterized NAD(P)/FAD-binding protein YdhS
MSGPPRSVVIVGAGFCGTVLAVNLLRLAHGQPLHIILIERAQFARGLAYSRLRYPYLLNVPAGRMSATCEDPDEFLAFARRSHADAAASDFLPRELYGEYLESLLRSAERRGAPGTVLQRICGVAVAIERHHRRLGFTVHMADGRSIGAGNLVLATGNPAPAALPGAERLRGSARYVADPWQAPPRFQPGESVLIVGTGLTMADVVLAGLPADGRRVQLHLLSRRGLIPAAQTPFVAADSLAYRDTLLSDAQTSVSLVRLSREVRRLAQELAQGGDDWRTLITAIRKLAPELWQRMPARARRRFVTHLRPYWDVHRHRIPASTAATLDRLQQDGQLKVHAARVLGFEPAGQQIRVHFQPRGRHPSASLLVHRLINCTGPDYDVTRTRESLLRGLLAQGLVSADPLHLGLVTDSLGRLIGASGSATPNLYYAGPLLRARDWESTAAAELRVHAQRLAQHLSATHAGIAHDIGTIVSAPQWRAGAVDTSRISVIA